MKKIISIILVLAMAMSMICTVSAEGDEKKHAIIELLQFDIKPNIDGVVSNAEWGQPIAEANAQNHVCYAHKDTPEISFTIWMGYDFEGLYIAIKNKDDKHNNPHLPDDPNNMWRGDCVQLRLDEVGCTADQGLLAGGRDTNWSDKMSEFAFAMDANGDTYSYCWYGVSAKMALDSGNGQYRIAHSGGYTTYELYIPWENIVEEAPCVGASHGITIGMLNSTTGEQRDNWMEWGCGLFSFSNRFGENVYGSNKIIYTDKTLSGGPSLTDPKGNVTAAPLTPPEKAEGDYIYFDLSAMEKASLMTWEYDEDNNVASITYSGSDSHIQYSLHNQVDASADDYKYLAIYGKTNTYLDGGRLYFTTAAASSFGEDNSEYFWFAETEEKQLVLLDLTLNGYWEGKIGELRFDFVDPYGNETPVGVLEELATEIYAIALFKTEADAKAFNVAEINIDPSVTLPADTQTAPVEETKAPAVDTDPTTDKDTDADTVVADVTTSADDDKGGNGTVIAVVIAVVVLAVAGAGVFFFMKKKKKA